MKKQENYEAYAVGKRIFIAVGRGISITALLSVGESLLMWVGEY